MNSADAETLQLIEELSRFSGPEDAAQAKAEAITFRLMERQNQVRIAILKSQKPSTELDRQRDSDKLLTRRLRSALEGARTRRQEKWFERRKRALVEATKEGLFDSVSKDDDEEDSRDVARAEQVTQSMRRIHQMAHLEVLKGEMNIEELDAATKSLIQVQNTYSAVDLLLNGSRRLVKLLDEADTRDRRMMMLSLSFLGAVVCWIIYRRVLKLPLKLLFWLIMRLVGLGEYVAGVSSSVRSIREGPLSASDQSIESAASSTSTFISRVTEVLTVVEAAVTKSAGDLDSLTKIDTLDPSNLSETLEALTHTLSEAIEIVQEHLEL